MLQCVSILSKNVSGKSKKSIEYDDYDEIISTSEIETIKKYPLQYHEVSQFFNKDLYIDLITLIT